MIRTSRFFVALMLAALATPVFAQSDTQPDAAPETANVEPAEPAMPVPAVEPVALAAPAQAGAPYGTLTPSGGGYAGTLWVHASGAAVERYLKLLPETVLSPMTHELLRRALLTTAAAPPGTSEDAFLRARIGALLAIGDAGDAGALLRTVPANAADAPLAQKVVDGEFYAAQIENGCLDVRSYAGKFGDAYWRRALVVCELSAGQKTEAQRDLTSVPGDGGDPQFTALAGAVLQSGQASVPDVIPTALDEALLRIGHSPLPQAVLRSDDVVGLSGVARTDTFQPATRVEAGYAAAVQGGFGILDMLALLREPGAGDQPPAGQTIARDDPTTSMAEQSHREAGLVQQVDHSSDGGQKVQLLRQMLTADSETVDVPFLSRVEFLRMQTMSGDRGALAPAAARGFLLEGDVPAAQRWYDIARKSGNSGEVQRLWPLAHIAFDSPESGRSDPALESWAHQTIEADKENGPKRVERALAAISALGEPISDSLWSEAVGKPDDEASIMGSMAISASLARAVQKDSKGEAIILVALSLKDGPGHAHPLNLNHSVSALYHIGMLNQAKAVALEGLAPVTQIGEK